MVRRLATAAPEGTAWAREAHAFARAIETETHRDLHVKWYLGSVAGDERAAWERLKRGQLDGLVVGPLCARLSPAMRVFAAPGLQLKRTRLWVWDEEDADRLAFSEMGFTLTPLPVWDAFQAFEQRRVDGFITTPTAMLAFQWNSQARYVLDLTVSWFAGCAFMSQRAFDPLTNAQKEIVRASAARFIARIEDIGHVTDDELMGGIFERHGLERVVPAAPLRAAFATAARGAVDRLGPKLVPADLFDRARPSR